jgi:hypothetical protein
MKPRRFFYSLPLAGLLLFQACEEPFEDAVPERFYEVKVNPDEIYMYNGDAPEGVRLDPLLNDSIKVDVGVSYGIPSHGTITFLQNEGWFYKPEQGYVGTDAFNYTVCVNDDCYAAQITMHVEEPLDLDNCVTVINGESVETTKDQPVEIRIFLNDITCPYQGSSIFSPEKGTFETYAYSGSIKNVVYVYYPPKGFTGTDRFRYKLFTPDGDLEAFCDIIINN